MHSSRMRTAHAMTGRISGGGVHTTHASLPFAMHASHHAHNPFAMHTPLRHTHPPSLCMPPPPSPHTPPSPCTLLHHACPPLPCTPPQSNHACPLSGATMHPSPRSNHPCPPPEATTHAPPVNRITDRCKNITFANYVCGR